jgi:hypothetical protein
MSSSGKTKPWIERVKKSFRWRYPVAAFLVAGVLSIAIGREDPLAERTKDIQYKYDTLFKMNKDPATASTGSIDGPDEKTFPLDSEKLKDFVREMMYFNSYLTSESVARAHAPGVKVDDPAMQTFVNAAMTYQNLQFGLLKNFMRLAHDANWSGSAAGSRAYTVNAYDFLNLKLDPKFGFFFSSSAGRDLSKQFNVRNVKDAQGHYSKVEFFINPFEKQIAEYEALANPRDSGGYRKLIQFAALREGMANRWAIRRLAGGVGVLTEKESVYTPAPDPMAGGGYFSEKVSTLNVSTLGMNDGVVNSCAPDLSSFRSSKPGSINDLEAYSSLWQQDRYTDLKELGTEAAANATKNQPLATVPEYADLYISYIAGFPEFKTLILPKFADQNPDVVADRVKKYYLSEPRPGVSSAAATVAQIEETNWSAPQALENGSKIVLSQEMFQMSSLPADDMSFPAVADRYVDRAFEAHIINIANGLVGLAQTEYLPESEVTKLAGSEVSTKTESNVYDDDLGGPGTTSKVVPDRTPSSTDGPIMIFAGSKDDKEFTRALTLTRATLAPKEAAWKAAVSKEIQKALLAKLGLGIPTKNGNTLGLGFQHGQDAKRYAGFVDDVKKAAATGARGIQAVDLAKVIEDDLLESVNQNCTAYNYGGGGLAGISTYDPDGACRMSYDNKKTFKGREAPGQYAGFAPFRTPARLMGVKDLIIPETAEQLTVFFRKKMALLMEYDKEKDSKDNRAHYGEPGATYAISKNAIVMRGIDQFFQTLSEMVSKSNSAGKNGDCLNVMSQAQTSGMAPTKALTADQCSVPSNDEAEGRRSALEAAIIPAAKKAYEAFLKGLETPGVYKYPERAKLKNAEIDAKKKADAAAKAELMRKFNADTKNFRPYNPYSPDYSSLVAAVMVDPKKVEADRKAAEVKASADAATAKAQAEKDADLHRRWGYYWPGADRSLEKEGGELYIANQKEREAAKLLYIQALGMLGIAQDVTGVDAHFHTNTNTMPDRIFDWVGSENAFNHRVPGVRRLERMVASVTDQHAMGQVLTDEALARAPVLSIQPGGSWRNDEDESPNLEKKLSKQWSVTKGWNDAGFQKEFQYAIAHAAKNDVDKVESFCRADIRNYEKSEDFRLMFKSVTGIRSALNGNPKIKKWDEEIAKATRTWQESFIDFVNDHSSIWFMVIVIAVQIVAGLLTGGTSMLLTIAAGQLTWGIAVKALASFLIGNLGINAIFLVQAILMIQVNFIMLPPQMGFAYQVANSQIQNMEMGRPVGTSAMTATKFANVSLADRERLSQMREELLGAQTSTLIQVGMEAMQARVFTYPGIRKTLAISGQKFFRRMVAGAADKGIYESIRTKTFREVLKANNGNWRAAVKEYWPEAWVAIRTFERKAIIKGGEDAKQGLESLAATRLANDVFKDKSMLRRFYQGTRDRMITAAKATFEEGSDAALVKVAKEYKVDLGELRKEFDDTLLDLRKDMAKTGALDEQITVVLDDAGSPLQRQALNKMLEGGRGESIWNGIVSTKKGIAAQRYLLDSAEIDKALNDLAKDIPTQAGESEAAAFLRSRTPTEFGRLRQFLKDDDVTFWKEIRGKNPEKQILEASEHKAANKVFKDLDYLEEDWKRADRVIQARRRFAKTGHPDIYVGTDGTVFGPADFIRGPDGRMMGRKVIPALIEVVNGVEVQTRGEIVKEVKFEIDPEEFYLHPDRYTSGELLLKKNGSFESVSTTVRQARNSREGLEALEAKRIADEPQKLADEAKRKADQISDQKAKNQQKIEAWKKSQQKLLPAPHTP